MFVVFYTTNNVFLAEDILNENNINCEIVPTPVQDKAYCGVCLDISIVHKIVVFKLLKDIDFKVIEYEERTWATNS